ncbi:MAG: hypothetical protein LBK94_10770 [Prevotellaceae bacterium]|jgi:hypothetical protein|nr:hypothetical protein [Prevotellaceae bacterium]
MKNLQGFNQYRHKTLQIKFYLLFFCLDTKEAKNQGDPSRRSANGINVSLRLTKFRFNAVFAKRVPRLRSLCRFYLLINFCSRIQANFSDSQHAEKLIAR